MSFYEGLLAVHIIATAIWIGADFAAPLLALRAEQRGHEVLGAFAQDFAWYARRFNIGASLVVLATAFPLTIEAGYTLSEPWLIFGLVGWIVSFGCGAGYLGPTTKRIGDGLVASGGVMTTQLQTMKDRVLVVTNLEQALLLLIIADMVIKPGA